MFKLSYPKKLFWIAQLKYWGILGVLLLLLFLDIKYGISKINFTFQTITTLLSALFGFVFYPTLIAMEKKGGKIADKILADADAAKLGIEGEKKVNDELHKILDDKIFRIKPNFKFKDKNFDIDFVVLGPKGIVLFEVKNYTYKLKFFDNFVSYIYGGVERQAEKDPRVALGSYTDDFVNYLYGKGFKNLLINRAVIIVDESKVEIATDKTGTYIVCGVGGIKDYMNGLKEDSRYDVSFCHQLEDALK